MNSLLIRNSLLAVILLLSVPAMAAEQDARQALVTMEQSPGDIAVVVYCPVSGRIDFMYNPRVCVSQAYPPGSLMKVPLALLLAGGELPLCPADPCRGFFSIPESWPLGADERGTFNIIDINGHNALRCSMREGHGPLDLDGALARSCNAWFLQQVASDPARSFSLLVRRFALDRPAGARLREYLPEPARPVAARVSPLQMAAACVGEGGAIRLTPLKVAQVFGAIWSGTPLLAPTETDATPVATAPLELDNQARNRVRSVMTRVVGEGTLAVLGGQRFTGLRLLGGKTGTATHYQRRYATHGWNVIVYEHDNNTLLLTVFVREGSGPKEAATVSATVLRELYK